MKNEIIAIIIGLLVAFIYQTEVSRYTLPKTDEKDGSNDVKKLDISDELKHWHSKGKFVSINGFSMYYQMTAYTGPKINNSDGPPMLILIHGFPTSSYDYHLVLPLLAAHVQVLVFDHVGFGFSDKPQDASFAFSMAEHAEQALCLWQTLGLREAHIVAHDMGDTILTEILARKQRGLLPNYFQNFFTSVTFTNGGMLVEHINFRITQRLLLHPLLGPLVSSLASSYPTLAWLSRRQLASIWSPTADPEVRDSEVAAIVELNHHRNGSAIFYKLVRYLNDRFQHQPRYLSAVTALPPSVLCHLIWGDQDAVSPPELVRALASKLTNCRAQFLERLGHFPMLEAPQIWTKAVLTNFNIKTDF